MTILAASAPASTVPLWSRVWFAGRFHMLASRTVQGRHVYLTLDGQPHRVRASRLMRYTINR